MSTPACDQVEALIKAIRTELANMTVGQWELTAGLTAQVAACAATINLGGT